MVEVKTTKLNKQEREYQRLFEQSNAYSLFDVYRAVSRAEWNAWKHCEAVCNMYSGSDLKVISYNGYQFTAAFEFDNPDTGACSLYVITKNREFAFEEELEE